MLSERVKALRAQHGLSLRQLAEVTGLSAALLSQVERGVTDPSLSTVRRLAEAFGTDLATLFAEQPPGDPHVSRPGHRPLLSAGEGAVVYERLTPGRSDLEVLRGRLEPGRATSPEPWGHASVECAVVLAGTLTVLIGDGRHDLLTGESISFDSRAPHRYLNTSTVPVEFLVAVTPPNP
ncbi:helix-turn-helix domain-containing protein [Kineococcus sp. SYSU DK002]|uniref:helix-turn-helix domain-containing protein n=1 Tax=Kineococcus sp. SYSU DK002 TaxID=3383123 RepID=UPI003D7C8125